MLVLGQACRALYYRGIRRQARDRHDDLLPRDPVQGEAMIVVVGIGAGEVVQDQPASALRGSGGRRLSS